ncbi:MAG: histidine kinase [Saprospiraceae bacterium]|nr:histidine kinase [Saprospiraceae bacterium]
MTIILSYIFYYLFGIFKYSRSLFFACLICANNFVLLSQSISLDELHIRRLSTRDGLLNNNVNIIYQDSRGLMWMGGNGLQRYDGYRFQNYLNSADNILITQIVDDKDNNIYVTNGYNQLLRYNRSSSSFRLFQDSVFIGGKSLPLIIQQMQRDKAGNVWILLYGELAVIRPGDSSLSIVSEKWGMAGPKHYGHSFLENDTDLWMLSKENGILRYNIKTKILSSRKRNIDLENVFDYEVTNESTMTRDGRGNLWFTDYKVRHLIRYDPISRKKNFYYFPYQNLTDGNENTFIRSIYLDKRGNIWVVPGEYTGLARFDYAKDKFEIIYSDKSKEYGFYSDIVIGAAGGSLIEDHQGNFWCTGDGILMFNPNEQNFRTILTQDVVKKVFDNPLSKQAISQSSPMDFVQMSNGKIYVGYYGIGIVEMDKNLRNPKFIKLPNGVSELIWKLFTPDGETLYFGDQKKQLYRYNVLTRQFVKFYQKQYRPAHLSASFVESSRTVWLGFYNNEGLRRFDPITKKFQEYRNVCNSDTVHKTHIYDIEPEGECYLWLATNLRGLLLFDKVNGKVVKSILPENSSDFVLKNTVHSIERINQDTLILSTHSGLVILNTKNSKTNKLTVENGMPENQCLSSVTESNKNFVWINTAVKGICKLDLLNMKVSQIESDQGNVLVLGSSPTFKSENGEIVFAHSKGFSIINQSYSQRMMRDSVYFTCLMVNHVIFDQDSFLQMADELRIDYADQNIKIGFSTLNYWKSSSTEYLIFISGIHRDWESLGNKSEIVLRGLAPGRYQLNVKAIDKNTLQETPVSKFRIYIEPPFYRSWWFIVTIFGLFISILYKLVKWRQSELLKLEQLKSSHYKQELEVEQQKREVDKIRQEMTEVQLSALRSQMNPHFIFNSLNSINHFIIKNDIHTASDYLTKFAKLIRLILDNSKNEEISLAREIDTLKLYLLIESVRLNNKFSYEINIDKNIYPELILVTPTTLQPFVENAIWHGLMHLQSQGTLVIDILSPTASEILITINDNGVGMVKSKELNKKPDEHRSHGVDITKSRIMQHHPKNSIQIVEKFNDKGESTGTLVKILLNLHVKKYEV